MPSVCRPAASRQVTLYPALNLPSAPVAPPSIIRSQGLISNNWGGTPIEYWSPAEVVNGCPGGWGNATGNDTSLYNAMIVPYTVGPMAMHHVLWFQVR